MNENEVAEAPHRPEREITLVFGKTGMGKTRWTRQVTGGLSRAIILDPMGEYQGISFWDLNDMAGYCREHKLFRVRTEDGTALNVLSCLALVERNCCLVVEESQRIIPPVYPLPSYFSDILYRGRHAAVSAVIVAQRAATTHIACRSQWSRIITFRQSEQDDVRWLIQTTGFDLPEIRTLGVGEYYDIRPDSISKHLLGTNSRTPLDTENDSDQDDTQQHKGAVTGV